MKTTSLLRTAAAALALTGVGFSGAALAHDGASSPRAAASSRPAAVAPSTPVSVEHQTGLVIEATGDGVWVSVYENQLHGNTLQVVLGDPELDLIGHAEQAAPFVVDGKLDVTVTVDGKPARLTGTVVAGGTSKLVEPLQDGGEQIVTRSRQTRLVAELTLAYDGVSVPLAAGPAFAYDNEVRKVALYGG